MSWGMQEEDRLIDADNVIYIRSTYMIQYNTTYSIVACFFLIIPPVYPFHKSKRNVKGCFF